jgi:hypothetical protein
MPSATEIKFLAGSEQLLKAVFCLSNGNSIMTRLHNDFILKHVSILNFAQKYIFQKILVIVLKAR